MKCENIKCNNDHDGSYGSGKFCSRPCSNSRGPRTDAVKNKISIGVKQSISEGKVRKQATQEEIESNIQKVKATWNKKLLEADFDDLGWDSKRKRIIFEQAGQCVKCGLSEWLGQPLILEIDHINGCNNDDKRENLEGLCPNCHSTTDTWRGRNKQANKIIKPHTTDEARVRAYLETGSIRQALLKLGLAAKGANYGRVKRALTLYNIEYTK